MRAKFLVLGLIVWFIIGFGMSTLAIPQMQRVEWEDKGTASVVILSAVYDEVWEKVLDILLFEKFKPKGAVESTHEAISVEKDAGFIVVKGFNEGVIGWYRIKVTFRQKDCNVFVRCTVSMAQKKWRKNIIETFFQLLGED